MCWPIYEEAWQRDENYEVTVANGWEERSGASCLLDLERNLNHMHTQLNNWRSIEIRDVKRKIKKVRKEFEQQKGNLLYRGSSPREKELARQLNELLHMEEIMAR